MKHDYESALNQRYLSDAETWVRDCGDIIEHALRLAAKVTGEPSEGMFHSAYERINEGLENGDIVSANDVFKTMIAQAEREIE